jgi:hypothetical protein
MGLLFNASALAQDTGFRNRALAALIGYSLQAIGEPEGTPELEQRVLFAKAVILSPTTHIETVSWILACDPTVSAYTSAAEVPDELIISRIAAVFTGLAGKFNLVI